jgi:arsenical pump membrane protein
MALPWLAAIGVEYLVISRFFAVDLGGADGGTVEHAPVLEHGDGGGGAAALPEAPVFSLVALGATLGGFAVASAAGVNPAWAALGGALLFAVRALARRETTAWAIARSADVPFLLFVVALGIVVVAVVDNGLQSALRPVLPSGSSLPALLAIAGLAAVLAATVNNLPAVLVLLPLVAVPGGGPGAVLAVLIGVNIGPNLTYTGSLATLLWRRVLHGADADVPLGEFTRLGVATVPAALLVCVTCLWLSLQV